MATGVSTAVADVSTAIDSDAGAQVGSGSEGFVDDAGHGYEAMVLWGKHEGEEVVGGIAAVVALRDNPPGKQALLRYVQWPPLAQQRLQPLPDGMIRLTLKRAFSDGTFAIDLDPLSLLCRLAAAVRAPGFNTVRYGVPVESSWCIPAVKVDKPFAARFDEALEAVRGDSAGAHQPPPHFRRSCIDRDFEGCRNVRIDDQLVARRESDRIRCSRPAEITRDERERVAA